MGEGNADEYKQKIIDVINSVKNVSILKYIYTIITTYLKSRGI